MTFDEAVKFLRETYDDPGICEIVDKATAPTQAPMQPSDEAIQAVWRKHSGITVRSLEHAMALSRAILALAAPTQAGGEAQSDLPPPDSAYWVNHDVTSPYTERAKPADTPYNLGWMSGWAAHGRAYPEQAAPAAAPTQAPAEARKPLTDEPHEEDIAGNLIKAKLDRCLWIARYMHGCDSGCGPIEALEQCILELVDTLST